MSEEKITSTEIKEFRDICKKLSSVTGDNSYNRYEFFNLRSLEYFPSFIKAFLEIRKKPGKFFLHNKEIYVTSRILRKELLHDLIKYQDRL